MLGQVPQQLNWQTELAKLLQAKGGTIIDGLMSKTGMLNNNPVLMNGTAATANNDEDINQIIEELKKHDPELKKHLRKLLNVAIQLPDLFKTVLQQLDDIGG
jgi:hypothetical protein